MDVWLTLIFTKSETTWHIIAKISAFLQLIKKWILSKFGGFISKIEPAMPIWSLNFKRAWQAQFLSHTHETLEKYVFYIDLEMILVPFFKINNRIWDKNFANSCHIHILSHPWPSCRLKSVQAHETTAPITYTLAFKLDWDWCTLTEKRNEGIPERKNE